MNIKFLDIKQVNNAFGWQGGEPTPMGVEFFRRVTELQRKYGRSGAVVTNGLQTNATVIDDEFEFNGESQLSSLPHERPLQPVFCGRA